MRGINFPHVWFPTQTATTIPNIAATGANCVRIVLGSGHQWGPTPASEIQTLIDLCKANKMIAVLEVHDSTGFGDTGGFARFAVPMSTAVDYWLSIQETLKGQENFVIINIANEPHGNGVPAATWVSDNVTAITRLRAAGLTHTIMVDAANWGQDWEQIMLNNASTVFAADPLKNVIFSVHMYQVYEARTTIQNYLSTFVTNKLPILVGEFGADHQGSDVDEGSILEISQILGTGYIGWSWSGNGGGTESLDIALNFNPATLSGWGNTLINSVNGISATSQLASVFPNVTLLQLSPTALSFTTAAQTATINVKASQSWTVSDNQDWLTVSAASGTGLGSITVSAAANTDIAPRTGRITFTSGTLTRTITVNQVGTGGPGVCSNAVAITLPRVQNGVGEFCWVTSGNITSVNSWSMQSVEINGVELGNRFSNVLPPRIDGKYYIRYIAGQSFSHLEIAGTAGTANIPATGITLTPATGSVLSGGALALTATVAPANASNKGVTWTSSNPAAATVNSSGAVTGVAAGTAIITATTLDGGFTATTTVTVLGSNIPATGVTLAPATFNVGIGVTVALTATVSPANATNKAVTWTSSSPAVAMVSASGVVTGVSSGTATITVRTASGGFTATSVAVVGGMGAAVTGVTVSPATTRVLLPGPSVTLTATVTPANAANKTVTWSSSNPAAVAVSATGVLTAISGGSAVITATTQSGGFTASSTVTVVRVPPFPNACSNPAPSTLPFVRNGVGDFCFVTSGNISFVNSWNMQSVVINGVDFTNKWSNSMPARINGTYEIRYVATVAWAHLEVNGTP